MIIMIYDSLVIPKHEVCSESKRYKAYQDKTKNLIKNRITCLKFSELKNF